MKILKYSLLIAVTILLSYSCSMDHIATINIDKHQVNIPANGGTATINVESTAPWHITIVTFDTGALNWLKTSTKGSDVLISSFDILAESINDTGKARSGKILISSGESSRTVDVIQEAFNIEIEQITGNWEIFEAPAFSIIIGSTFNFNEDMSCAANMKLPSGEINSDGTYTLDGNIITIDTGSINKIIISVKNVTETEMKVSVSGIDAKLRRYTPEI